MLNSATPKTVKLYWIVGIAQVIHSIEEMGAELYTKFGPTSEWLHAEIPFIPVFTLSADIFAILNMIMIAIMLAPLPWVEKWSHWVSTLFWTWAIVEVANGLFHVSTWLYLHYYFPGGISGPILLILGILLIQQLTIKVPSEATVVSSDLTCK